MANWTDEELILALCLQLENDGRSLRQSDREVIAMSNLLRKAPFNHTVVRDSSYRPPDGVRSRLGNLRRLLAGDTKNVPRNAMRLWEQYELDREALFLERDRIVREIERTGVPDIEFELGKEYKRTDIHAAYGGQHRGSISTPKNWPFVFVFTSVSGEQFGYVGEGKCEYFHYAGEGQSGDVEMRRGSRAIRDHIENDKRLLVFSQVRKGFVEFLGEFLYVDYEEVLAADENGNPRTAFRFALQRTDQEAPLPNSALSVPPNRTERQGLVTSRVGQGAYRTALLEKFRHQCAVKRCGPPEILIASHIVPWKEASDAERLDPENGILLSPTYDALFDRRLISFARDGTIVMSRLLKDEVWSSLGVKPSDRIDVTPKMIAYLTRHLKKLKA